MRAARPSCLAILLWITLGAPGTLNASETRGPQRAFTDARLPAPITITTGRESARIGRDGRIARIPNPRPAVTIDAVYIPGTDTWYEIHRGHLVVGRGRRTLWRSHGLFPLRLRLGLVAAGSQGVAFSYHKWLYVASPTGAERPVARREGVVGWTTGGVYTYGGRGNRLLLRGATGRVIATVARRPAEHEYDPATGSVYVLAHGVLSRAHGAHVRRLASLASLGLPPRSTWMQALGGLVELMSANRLTLLRPDGSVFASTPARRTGGQTDTISGGPTVAPRQTAVAFTAASGTPEDPRNPHSTGTEAIYLLRPGATAATEIHRERVAFAPCERGAGVQWQGSWLLYGNSEGNLAAVETTGAHRAIELAARADRVLGAKHDARTSVRAYWSGQPPEL